MPLSWSRAVQRYADKWPYLDFDQSEVDKVTSSDLYKIKTYQCHYHGELNLQRTESKTHRNPPNNSAIRIFLKMAYLDFDHSEVD